MGLVSNFKNYGIQKLLKRRETAKVTENVRKQEKSQSAAFDSFY